MGRLLLKETPPPAGSQPIPKPTPARGQGGGGGVRGRNKVCVPQNGLTFPALLIINFIVCRRNILRTWGVRWPGRPGANGPQKTVGPGTVQSLDCGAGGPPHGPGPQVERGLRPDAVARQVLPHPPPPKPGHQICTLQLTAFARGLCTTPSWLGDTAGGMVPSMPDVPPEGAVQGVGQQQSPMSPRGRTPHTQAIAQ